MSNKINFELIKINLKLILMPVVVVLFLGGILLYFFINGQPKTVATYEQVWTAIENKGIIPTDTTEMFKTAWKERNDSKGETLQKALTFINPDSGIDFNFFIFDDDKSAHSARVSYWNYIRYDSGRFGTKGTNQEYQSSSSNYTVYWVKYDNFYTVCTRVGNTVIYAEADANSNKLIKDIIEEIGYQ
ncbi:MAG: hypothetical protein IJN65_02635 [Clostridia bacterium]|nr:hypothetical protein [Clostridia bacterium]